MNRVLMFGTSFIIIKLLFLLCIETVAGVMIL